jgi:uncharacterized protein
MADHPNVELFKKGYAAFSAGDMEGVKALFAPDVVWNQPGKNHFSGEHRGVDNVLALFLAQAQESEGTFKVEVHDILANDEHAVALATVSATKGGKTLRDRYTHVAHIKGGKLTESWIFGEHQDEEDAFWG